MVIHGSCSGLQNLKKFEPVFFNSHKTESPIRAVDKFCVQPQRASCQVDDGTVLVYKSAAQCSEEYQKFIYDNGVLTHKCSGKYVCPRGLLMQLQISENPTYVWRDAAWGIKSRRDAECEKY